MNRGRKRGECRREEARRRGTRKYRVERCNEGIQKGGEKETGNEEIQ